MKRPGNDNIGEPSLREVIDDPMTEHAMNAWGVPKGALHDLLRETAGHIRNRHSGSQTR